MTLVRYQPWDLLDRFQDEINRTFGTRSYLADTDENTAVATSQWVPAVDIKEEENRFVLHADLPGVEANEIDITMEKGQLTLKGERSDSSESEQDGYRRVERRYGSFYRRFSLPDSADADGIEARSTNGVLEIVIPKKEQVKPRRIAVKH